MSRTFSLAYLTIPGTDPMEQIRIARACGYDSVSLRTIPMHLPGEPEFLPHRDEALFRRIKSALQAYDMPIMDIELARVRPDLDIEEEEPALGAGGRRGAADVRGSGWGRGRAVFYREMS